MRGAYEAARHAIRPVEGRPGAWQANNPGQGWTTRFDGRGFVAAPEGGGWSWGLELRSYGFAGSQRSINGAPSTQASGQRFTYTWDGAVQEWYVNDQRGLEHGFTVNERPRRASGSGASDALSFVLSLRGELRPRVHTDALGVEFRDASGAAVLQYAGLKVWDADGRILPSGFGPLDPADPSAITITVDERNARYPLTIDPIAQQAYLKPAAFGATQAGDLFGGSVAVSGDTVVVGAVLEDSSTTGVDSIPNESAPGSGAAYVFVRSGSTWTQQAYLKAGNTGANDAFGGSVDISGDTIVVGAWLEDSSTIGVNSTPDNAFADSGAAYVFVRTGTTWTQQAYLKASNTGAGDFFGARARVSGDTIVVGADSEDGSATGVNGFYNEGASGAGAAYVFARSGTTWTQQAYLKASNTGAGDSFGNYVAVSGDTVVVGAYAEDSSSTGVDSTPDESATSSGAAYVFARSGSTWSQQAYLKASNTGPVDVFGLAVAVSGDTVVVGARGEDSGTSGVNSTPNESGADSGAAYVFVRSGSTWTQQAYLKAGNPGVTDTFGDAVAVSGDLVVVGAPLEDSGTSGVNSSPDEAAASSGAAYVFTRSASTWTQQAYLKASNPGPNDTFGSAVSASGDTVVVGARYEGSGTTGVNSTPDESAAQAGAAYTFSGFGVPEISVAGNSLDIGDGDSTPDSADHTDFGSVDIAGGTVTRTFTIGNSGGVDLTLGSVIVAGAQALDFTVDLQPVSPVPAGGSTTFQVTFDPSATGFRDATLSLANNDGDESPFNFGIKGGGTSGSCPIITLSSLPNGILGTPYAGALAASGGGGPYTYAVTSGSMPPGLSLNVPNPGDVTGTPTATGTFTFDITATDTFAPGTCTGAASYSVIIAPSAGAAFVEDFSDNSAGWPLGSEWEIGPAIAGGTGSGGTFPDPGVDTSPTSDNHVAGMVIGGNITTLLHAVSYLTSPAIDTTGLASVQLSFQRWLNSDYRPYMDARVEVFNGSAWVIVWQNGTSGVTQDNAWIPQAFNITAHSNALLRVRFGLGVGAGGAFSVTGWNVDDVRIGAPTENCGNSIDDDGDGLVDGLDPDCIVVSVTPAVSINEGSSGSTPAGFTLTRTGALSIPHVVSYSTTGLTATSGVDFGSSSGTLTFGIGQATGTVNVPVYGDTVFEPTEAFRLDVVNGAQGASGIGTIVNDDLQVLALDDFATVPLNGSVTIQVLANDSGLNDTPLTVMATNPAGGFVVVNPDNSITYTPYLGFAATDTFTYTVTDVDNESSTATVSVAVSRSVPFIDGFADTSGGWTLGPEWQIGPASPGGGGVGGFFPDPGLDTTLTSDNGIAGMVIGGNITTDLHPISYLTSPPIDTTSLPNVELTFRRWLNVDYPNLMDSRVEVFDGSTWVVLWQTQPGVGIKDNAWTLERIDLTPYSNTALRVRFGTGVGQAGAFSVSGWNIDDVRVGSPTNTLTIQVVSFENGLGQVFENHTFGPSLQCDGVAGATTTCISLVPLADYVSMYATPDPMSVFVSMDGCDSGGLPCSSFMMTGPQTITVTFRGPQTLTLEAASFENGVGELFESGAGGSPLNCSGVAGAPTVCTKLVRVGETISVYATPNSMSVLNSITGCTPNSDPVSPNGEGCQTFQMTGPQTVTATFRGPQTLTLEAASFENGVGDVYASSAGGMALTCFGVAGAPATCTAVVRVGDTVFASALPGSMSILNSIAGCVPTSDPLDPNGSPCLTFQMIGPQTITGTFRGPQTLTLEAASFENGVGDMFASSFGGLALSCTGVAGAPTTCTAPVRIGDTVFATALPGSLSVLTSIAGCTPSTDPLDPNGSPCLSFVMTGPLTVNATFRGPQILTVVAVSLGNGVGNISATTTSSNAVDCLGVAGAPTTCTGPVRIGDTVTVWAVPGSVSVLDSIAGCVMSPLDPAGAPCAPFQMTGPQTITATFAGVVPSGGDLDTLDAGLVGNYVAATAVQPDGKIILAGLFTSVLGQPRANIARLNSDGTLDLGFDPSANGAVGSVAIQPDGKILLAGEFTTLQPNGAPTATTRRRIARLNADGTLDAGFDPNANSYVNSLAMQANGKVVLGGGFTALQPNGAASPTTRQYIARVNPDGTLDTGFDPRADNDVRSVVVQEDGNILLGGWFTTLQPNGAAAPTPRQHIARVNTDGTLDAGFDPRTNGYVYTVAEQADGKVLLGGAFGTLQPNGAASATPRVYIARVNADGTLDPGFDPSASNRVHSVAVQTDGKVLLGGGFLALQPNGALSATQRMFIARVNSDGTLDIGFDPNASAQLLSVGIQGDGRILLGGFFASLQPNGALNPTPRNRFARLLNLPATQTLTAPDSTRVSWVRGGTSPEVSQVTFEQSVNGGASWTALGNGARIGVTSDWELTGLSLPTGGLIRARGRTAGGYQNGTSGLVESVVSFGVAPEPEIVVKGNGADITDGDNVPDAVDHTDFGGASLSGGFVVRTFTVENSGPAMLTLGSIAVGGANASDFTATVLPPSPVLPGGSTTFQVTFDPSAVGLRSATLSLANNDADENPFDFSIQGTGTLASSTSSVSSSRNPSNLTESVTLTATVSGSSPTGTINFKDGASVICGAVPLVSGQATCTTSTLVVGAHAITADYSGDPANTASTGTLPGGQVVLDPTPVAAGDVRISQFRFRGDAVAGNGARNEFIELYINKPADVTVGADGWAVSVFNPASSTASTIALIPPGTILRAKSYYLIVNNSASSGFTFGALASYPAAATPVPTTVGSGDLQYSADIPDGAGLAIFSSGAVLDSSTRLDSVGFASAGFFDPLYREGTGLTPVGGITVDGEYVFLRKSPNGAFIDTGDNEADFVLIATDARTYDGRVSQLGAPGPRAQTSGRPLPLPFTFIEPGIASNLPPNRGVDLSFTPNRLEFRFRVTNNTGQAITSLRWRFVNLTNLNGPAYSNPVVADLRPITGGSRSFPATSIGVTTAEALSLELEAIQIGGGGLNSTLVHVLSTPLAPAQSVDINIVFEKRRGGTFRFVTQVEAVQ